MTATAGAASAYPVNFDVDTQFAGRNRLTVAFRIILAIPHLLLVGGPGGISPLFGLRWASARFAVFSGLLAGNVIGLATGVTSLISWFAIVFTGRQPRGLWDFANFYMRWRANAIAYTGLLRDEYPPFGTGDGAYPARFEVAGFPEARNRWSVGLRIIYAIPHIIILFFLSIAWAVTAVIAWFAILFAGSYPQGLYGFAVGYMRWSMRVQAYLLLMRDEYPPFSFD